MRSNIHKHKITEMFYSIQGEGYYSGSAAIFIRYHGCNLACSFCDEPSKAFKEYAAATIISKIKKYAPCHFVVITGGEPSVQPYLAELVESLQKEDYFVAVETNGTRDLGCSPDWITVSPKTDLFIIGNELKLLYKGQNLKDYEHLPFEYFYLQPINHLKEIDYASLDDCLHAIQQHPKWKLSIQLQKAIPIS